MSLPIRIVHCVGTVAFIGIITEYGEFPTAVKPVGYSIIQRCTLTILANIIDSRNYSSFSLKLQELLPLPAVAPSLVLLQASLARQ